MQKGNSGENQATCVDVRVPLTRRENNLQVGGTQARTVTNDSSRREGKARETVHEFGSKLRGAIISASEQEERQGNQAIGVGDEFYTVPARHDRPSTPIVRPSYDRQTRIFDPSTHNAHVAIIGLGNIGSNTAVLLARMGVTEFTLYDHDTIEAHNLSSQHFDTTDFGKTKVDSVVRQLQAINPDVVVHAFTEEYTGTPLDASIMVIAVDSMDIRKTILRGLKTTTYRPYIVDGRSGGGQLEVHSQCFSKWGKTLYDGADVDACGARFICYASAIVSGFITNTVKRRILKQKVKSRVIFHCDTNQLIQY